jgi:hypothetical protein
MPDPVAGQLQFGAKPADEIVVFWRGMTDEDYFAHHGNKS